MAGLYDDMRPGPPRSIDDERVASLIKTTLHTKPSDGSTHWSVRSAAAEIGISKSGVQRYFQLFGLQVHRTEGFKLSTDPFFIEKLRDVVGLYLSPPDKALVICVDEKSQRQALERAQPMLPMGFGYAEGVTHDIKRHGTTTLFAALNVINGAVLASCKPRHRHQEFLSFLREIDKSVPVELDIHCIVDNYATHSHPKVKAWLATRRTRTASQPPARCPMPDSSIVEALDTRVNCIRQSLPRCGGDKRDRERRLNPPRAECNMYK